jgi:hypothetical protein
MTPSNKKKSKFLGMPYGTASGRLRKKILFNLVQETERDVCFRCGEKIKSADEISIEHKKPWLGINVDLFWDLDNIAFSHLRCNIPHRVRLPDRVPPKGMEWCSGCQKFRPLSLFRKSKHTGTGSKRTLRYYCNECRKLKNWEK